MLETDLNKQDQYNRRNNLDTQGIPDSVPDDQLEEKIIEIFNQINVKINAFDIEDCHRIGKRRKRLLSTLLIERSARQFWKKELS